MEKKTASAIMLTLLLTSMLTLAFNIQPVKAEPTIIIVPDDYPAIQEAINKANNGDTVFVRSGTYYENILVNKSISLVGENREATVIDGGCINTLYVDADFVNITHFTLCGNDSCIYVSTRQHWAVYNLNVNDNYLLPSSSGLPSFNARQGVYIERNCAGCHFIGNYISNHAIGFYLYETFSDFVISDNFFDNCGVSAICLVRSGPRITVARNIVNNCGYSGSGVAAIVVDGSPYVNIENNTVECSVLGIYGFFLRPSTWDLRFIGNLVAGYNFGMLIAEDGGFNVFYHNTFVNNTQNIWAFRAADTDLWDDGYPSGGNYWSDYTGLDFFHGSNQNITGSDGIGDTPYIIDSDNLDRYPLMIPWGMSYSGYDWPMFHHDERHTGYSSSIAPNNNAILWTFDVYDASSPAIANGKVFVGSILGNVYALDASTGAVVWSAQKGGEAWAAPAVAYGKVFIGYTYTDTVWLGVIWALNETSGAEVWSYQLESYAAPVLIAPTVAYGKVFIGPCANEKVYALNATTGELLWSYATGGGERGGLRPSAVVMNNVVYVGSEDFKMYALNATNGTLIWNFTTGNHICSSPALSDGRVFVSSEDGRLYALNQTTGEQLWNSSITSLASSPAVADGIIFVGNQAFNETTGKLIWSSTIGPTSSSPAVADNKVFVASYGGGIFALDKTTGAEIWSFKPQGVSRTYNSPVVAYGKVFICLGSTLYAFGVHDIKVADVKPGKTVIGQNFTARIYVNITNEGGYKESFNVTVSANSSIIGEETIELMSGSSANMTFTWNTTGFAKGNYTVWAYAWPVSGETDTVDNTCIDGIVTVTIPGDVDGDHWVFLYDAVKLLSRYGAKIGDPQYDAVYDIDEDGRIFLYDAVILLAHYGQKDP
jgi:outer membrane protein assembly factor BamB